MVIIIYYRSCTHSLPGQFQLVITRTHGHHINHITTQFETWGETLNSTIWLAYPSNSSNIQMLHAAKISTFATRPSPFHQKVNHINYSLYIILYIGLFWMLINLFWVLWDKNRWWLREREKEREYTYFIVHKINNAKQ